MTYVTQTFLLCELKKGDINDNTSLLYAPEFACLQNMVAFNKSIQATPKLKAQFQMITEYQRQHGKGALPLKLPEASAFIEDLYNELLNNNIPLPPIVTNIDLRFHINKFDIIQKDIILHERKINLHKKSLTLFGKYFPIFGLLITFTLTMGFTMSAISTILGWGWSIILLIPFGISKLLTSYVDIGGGPERRFHLIGMWLDRVKSGLYANYGKISYSRISLHLTASVILALSCLLTWYSAWQMVCSLLKISLMPEVLSYSVTGLFALSSTFSNFGRIYNGLYELLFHYSSKYISFDNIKDEEKIELKQAKTNREIFDVHEITPSPSLLHALPLHNQPKNQPATISENRAVNQVLHNGVF